MDIGDNQTYQMNASLTNSTAVEPVSLTNTTVMETLLSTDKIIQLIIYLLILLIGMIGNILVILYFGFKKKVKQRFSHYLINLAFVDLLTSIFTPVNFVYTIISNHRWQMGLLSCIGISSLGPLAVNVSAWIITSIAIERHRGIKNPLQQRYSHAQIYFTMVFIWLISIGTLIPYMMSIDIEEGVCRPVWPNPHTEFAYSVVLLALQSVLPTMMMIIMFISIYRAVTDRGRFLSAHYCTPTATMRASILHIRRRSSVDRRTATEKRDKKLFRMLTIALAMFIMCSIPYNIFYTTLLYLVRIKKTSIDNDTMHSMNTWLSILVAVNACINFFIYAGMDKSFKSYCHSIVCRAKVEEEEVVTASDSARQSLISRLSFDFTGKGGMRRGSSNHFTRRRSSNRASSIPRLSFHGGEYITQHKRLSHLDPTMKERYANPLSRLCKSNTPSPEAQHL